MKMKTSSNNWTLPNHRHLKVTRATVRCGNLLLAILLTVLLSANAFGQPATDRALIPGEDNDLEAMISRANDLANATRLCNGGDCPRLSCDSARRINDTLLNARYLARYNYFWLKTATDRHKQQWLSTVNSINADEQRLAELQEIVAYQEYVTNIAGTMLDIAGVLTGLEDLASDPKKLEDMSRLEFLSRLDTLYEATKSFESASNTLSQNNNANTFNLDNADLNRIKSDLSDYKTIAEEAARNGRDWRSTVKSAKVLRSLGQIAGRYLRAYAESEIRERKQLAEEYYRGIKASERVLAGSYREFREFASRRDAAEDAYRSIERLFTAEGDISWLKCSGKLSVACGSFRNLPSIEVPEYMNVIFYGDDMDLARPADISAWGRALRYLLPAMRQVSGELARADIVEVNPSLAVERASLSPGDQISVNFTAPACFPPDSWIGLVGADAGTESVPSRDRHNLARRTAGLLYFSAPEEPGNYKLVMVRSGARSPAATVDFSVVKETEAVNSVSIACSSGSNGPGSLSGTVTSQGGPLAGQKVSLRLLYTNGKRKSRSVTSDSAGRFSSAIPIEKGEKGAAVASSVVEGKRIVSGQCIFGGKRNPIPAGHGRLTIVSLNGLGEVFSGSRVWIYAAGTNTEVAGGWKREFDLPVGAKYDIKVFTDIPLEAKGVSVIDQQERVILISGRGRLRIVSYDGSGTLKSDTRVIIRLSGSDKDFTSGWKREFDLPTGRTYDVGVFLDNDWVWRRGVSLRQNEENFLFLGAPRTASVAKPQISIACGSSNGIALISGTVKGSNEPVRLYITYGDGTTDFRRIPLDSSGRYSHGFDSGDGSGGVVRALAVNGSGNQWSNECRF